MIGQQELIKMIFGFKLKYLRQRRDLSLEELAAKTGLSKSYLHDIEKGKKYPKVDKIQALAQALDVDYDYLVSLQSDKKLEPVIELLSSDLLKSFPMEEFGLKPDKLFELLTVMPDKVNAFISTILKVTRNFQVGSQNLFLSALRSYQEMHNNYFPELEQAAIDFTKKFGLPDTGATALEKALVEGFDIRVDRKEMQNQDELKSLRSYYSPDRNTLFLQTGLSEAQERFLIGRELGFQVLDLSPRPYLTRVLRADSFELLLNNFMASYFSAALLMPERPMLQTLRRLARQPQWKEDIILNMVDEFGVTPEMLFQRLTNILPHFLGSSDMFFIRMAGQPDQGTIKMTKELHLSQLHQPYASKLDWHYCRRWKSVTLLKELQSRHKLGEKKEFLAGAQISAYWQTDRRYLILTVAKQDERSPLQQYVSVTIGLAINERLREEIRFLSDPALPIRIVHTTCETCSITDCESRAAPPIALEVRRKEEEVRVALERLDSVGLQEDDQEAF